MKDYIVDRNNSSTYIREVIRNNNGTLTVEFGDGQLFSNIAACDENIQKIIQTQEEQAKRGIEHFRTFVNQERSSKAKTILSGVGAFALGTGATFIPAVQEALSTQSPLVVFAGVGAITVLGMIPAYAKLRRNRQTVEELDKIRYRNVHLRELNRFREFPNSLAGIRPQLANWMIRQADPFCILHMDQYDKEDFMQIVSNIHTEETYGFTYAKRDSRNR